MGYSTDFTGRFLLDRELEPEHREYLQAFSHIRHMKRNPKLITKFDEKLSKVGLPLGDEAEFFVADQEDFGQERTPDIVDYNMPPNGVPGLWCDWVPSEDGMGIEWNGGEKFYAYVEWITFLIDKFLKPWGYIVHGTVRWAGEDHDDKGVIVVKDNKVTSRSIDLPEVTH